MKDPVIAVVGGGLGGLSFANAAVHHGLRNVTIYEQAPTFKEIGAGVHITRNAFSILDEYGLKDEMERSSSVPSKTYMIYKHYKSAETLATVLEARDPYARRIHRAHLLGILQKNVPADMLQTGKHLDRITSSNTSNEEKRYTLHFADGTSSEADIVIGCDGIHSKVRQYLGIVDDPLYSGQVVYRALLPRSALSAEVNEALIEMVNYRGPQRHVLIFPIGQGDEFRYNVVAFMKEELKEQSESWMTKAPVSELEEHVKDWHPLISKDLINALKETAQESGIMKQTLYVRTPNEKWYEGGVVLLGDSIHSTLPHQGQGTCQAIESGAALAILLKNARPEESPESAFQKFKELRKPRTDAITKTSAEAGRRAR